MQGLATLKRGWQLLTAFAAALPAYSLLGFFRVPHYATGAVHRAAEPELRRRIRFGDFKFNPCTSTVRVRNEE
jgi:hypothetical protein